MLLLLENAYKTSTSHDRNPIVQESGPWCYINNARQLFFLWTYPHFLEHKMKLYFLKQFNLQTFLWKQFIKGDYQLPEKVLSQQWESLINKKQVARRPSCQNRGHEPDNFLRNNRKNLLQKCERIKNRFFNYATAG